MNTRRMSRQFASTLAMFAVLAGGAVNSARADLTSAGLSTWSITGDHGSILSLNGITVASGRLITGTTLFYNGAGSVMDPSSPYEPSANADDFSLGTTASADTKISEVTMFPQSTTTIFYLEKNGNDSAVYQGLDALGNAVGASLQVNSGAPNWVSTGFLCNDSAVRLPPGNGSAIQTAYGMVLNSSVPIFGFRVTATTPGGATGIDPVSIIAVVPEPATISLFGLGLLLLLRRKP